VFHRVTVATSAVLHQTVVLVTFVVAAMVVVAAVAEWKAGFDCDDTKLILGVDGGLRVKEYRR